MYRVLHLRNDEHIQMITMTHNVFSYAMNVVELLVETRAVCSQFDVNVISQLILEDVPSNVDDDDAWSLDFDFELKEEIYEYKVEMDGVELAEGAIFLTKEAFRHATEMYSVRMNRDYRVIKTS
ncbi:uncharacterized protein G2W53_021802 [Senna tora]|uniref:Uncharacterized protein n=1 Tax=Senna tora TaxID=362788 RepID=A0A834TK83_9FABA|nr:uncharacterized protein G2W53_021802 [Senna tora]